MNVSTPELVCNKQLMLALVPLQLFGSSASRVT
jgi:hypothetical protein